MYQAEVKRYAVEHLFPPSLGWSVVVHLDPMEMGIGQSAEKQTKAAECAAWLRQHGVKVMEDHEFGRRDIVARHPERGTVLVEVEGESSRQREQALYSALGQAVLQMTEFKPNESYAIAVPDSADWERQLRKVPKAARDRLALRLYMVSEISYREV